MGQYLGHPLAACHLFVPCHGLGNPGRVEVGHLKLDADVTLVVAGEHRLPQRSLDVLFTQDNLVQVLFVNSDGLLLILRFFDTVSKAGGHVVQLYRFGC